MINEGMKLTAFDAMEAAMELNQLYTIFNTHDVCNFRYVQESERLHFSFYNSDKGDLFNVVTFSVPLDDSNPDDEADTFSDVFKKIGEEKDKMIKWASLLK
ncbi:MAG: hypothetical protein IKW45_05345 [Clostridia bacterium]|nr:hypothetical protein [Clostridia bacterium]